MAEFKIGRLRFTWKGQWAPATFYNRDAVIEHEGKTYVCLEAHTSADFYNELNFITPSGASTPYWKIMLEGSSWKGAYIPGFYYSLGNQVSYGGAVWLCTVPGTSAVELDPANWTIVISSSNYAGAWSPSGIYGIGDQVKYGGIVYTCTQGHQAAITATQGLEVDIGKWAVVFSGIEYKGDWVSSTRYKLNDVVKVSASLWIATTGHTAGADFDDVDWQIWIPGEEYFDLWDNAVTYDLGDVVKYGGYSYISEISENLNQAPSTNPSSWSLVTMGYNLRGDWTASTGSPAVATNYRVGDVVRRGGRTFVAIADNTAQDPSGSVVTANYNSTGSSGTTVVLSSNAGISTGMLVVGNGFTQRQTVTSVSGDGVTITVSDVPNGTPANANPIRFTGINAAYWKFVSVSTTWTNRWAQSVDYGIGDLAVWQNATYICVANHTSSFNLSPINDPGNQYWQIFLYHARKNAMNSLGDMATYDLGSYAAIHLAPQNADEEKLLQVTSSLPAWQQINVVPKVFYVTPAGADVPEAGTTWDHPWQSIKYACDTINAGFDYKDGPALLLQNRAYIEAEVWNWIQYQISQGNIPFNANPVLDEAKTKRDAGYVIDAIAYDMKRGGNSQTVATARSYFASEPGEKFITPATTAQMPYFIEALQQVDTFINDVLNNSPASTSYQTLNGIAPSLQTLQVIDTLTNPEPLSYIEASSLLGIIVTALTNEDVDALPPSNLGATATIMVKTGTYFESLPIVVPANVAINGDELRGAVVRPKVVVNTIATSSDSTTDRIKLKSYEGIVNGTPLQFVGTALEMFGGFTSGQTYYAIDIDLNLGIIVSDSANGPARSLTDGVGSMAVYGGDAVKNMFLMRDGTGLRNLTVSGLLGTLTALNQYETRRPTGGSFVSLDPGTGPSDSSAWIIRRSPYVQNVTTFGKGAVGAKIDGTLHNGGNKSIVANDFTQIISDGIGVWCTGSGSLTELVSVFSYYAYAGYMAEDGGRIRATNGNTSYGTYGVIAEGYDASEVPVTGKVYNQSTQVQANVQSSFGQDAKLVSINYNNAGAAYYQTTTNLLKESNHYDDGVTWTTDNNVSIQQNLAAPNGYAEGWTITGATSNTNSDYTQQAVTIQPAGATYTNISASNITGSGVGATFNVTVTSTSYTVTVNSNGSGYVSGNQMLISGSTLGGINNTNDCIITVATLSGSTILTVTSTGTVPAESAFNYTLSIYAKQGTATTFDLQGIFSGTSTKGSGITYNFSTDTITPYAVSSGFTPVQYGRTPLENGWFRIWFTLNDVVGLNNTLTYKLFPRGTSGIAGSYNYFYGSQAEISTATFAPSFYLETTTQLFTAHANYKVVGAGTGAVLVGDEIRSKAVFETRVTDPGSGAGGSGYLTASNAAQLGNETYIQLAGSNTNTASQLIGMRVFINSGTGAGQYGYISAFDTINKYAKVLKESFGSLTISASSSTTDALTISNGDTSNLYVNQQIQFLPTAYTTNISSVAVDQITVTGVLGGLVNTFTIGSTKRLRRNMEVTFSGNVFGGVTTGYVYYITDVLSDTTFQVSTTFGGTVWQLNTATPGPTPMYVNFPTGDSYINGSTTSMVPNMPIQFTGTNIGGLTVGTTYYVNDVIDANTFAISTNLVTDVVTDSDTSTDYLTITDTSGLVVFNPVIFSGSMIGSLAEDQKYYISKIASATEFQIVSSLITTTARASEVGSNLITVDSTANFIADNPIIFIGTTFGDIITEKIYYISAVNNSTTFTISATPGGSAVGLRSATGELVVKTTPAAQNVATVTGGSMALTTTSTKKTLTNGYGSMIGTYKTPLFGGVVAGTTYYVKTINAPSNALTISDSLGGATFQLSTKNGSMQLGEVGWDHINPGTPIESVLNSSSVYYIEPRTTFSEPGFSQSATTGVSLAPGSAWKAIAYGKERWMAIPDANATGAYSTNGTTWTSMALPGSYTWQDIAYGNNYWVIITSGGVGNSKAFVSKSNGLGWRQSTLPSATTWSKVAYGNGVFVAISTGASAAAYSVDFGATWTSATGFTNQTWTGLAYGNGMFVAVASASNSAAYSTDGITWTSVTLPASSNWSSVTYGKGRFVAVSSTNAYPIYSFDGATWYEGTLPLSGTFIEYGQGVFLAVLAGTTTTHTSEDGLHWTVRATTNTVYKALRFGYDSVAHDGKFITLAGTNTGSVISAGCRAKGRAVITSGVITSISLFEPGSNYTSVPTVTFTDPNVTTLAVVTPRLANGSLGNPTFSNRGTGYGTTSTAVSITGSGYADSYQTGLTIILNELTKLPQPGDNLVITGVDQIFKVTSASVKFGTVSPNIEANVQVAPEIKVAQATANGTLVTIRQKYSQARLTGHDFLNVGYGNQLQSNYPGLPSDTLLAPQDQAVEVNFGRVFYTSTDQDGNFKVGSLFAVEQATGIITLSASQFGLSGLETLSLGGIAVGGQSVIIRQFSTDPTFVANSNEIIPTQKAIKSYLTSRLSQGGSNTFTGQLTAGTVIIGGADKIASTIPEGTLGSNVQMLNKVMVEGSQAAWGGDGAAMAFFSKSWHHR